MSTLKLEKHNRSSKKSAPQGVADEKAADLTKSFEARPRKQPVDYAKMRKDIKTRFSKTLAHLAK
ncbi:MAG: hypothetical protein ABIS49_11805 [Aestuariivirga sp.]